MKITALKNLSVNKLLSILLLLAVLSALKAHADHFDVVLDNIDNQHCQLCQQNIDSPHPFDLAELLTACHYQYLARCYQSFDVEQTSYQVPPLRAPPQFLSV